MYSLIKRRRQFLSELWNVIVCQSNLAPFFQLILQIRDQVHEQKYGIQRKILRALSASMMLCKRIILRKAPS